jgi:cation diffusion facilitator family transporter
LVRISETNAMQEEGSRRAIVAAFLANLGIASAKFVAFLITGAASMLAEAVHSLADTGNQGLLILGTSRARREATHEHQFGFGRERYFWAFVVALVLFSLGSIFAVHEGIDKLRHPHELVSPAVAIGILVLAIALESWSFRTAIVAAQPLRGSKSWWSFIRRSKSPELPVVLLEDLGALLGLLIALVGVSLSAVFDDPRFDAAGSVVIGALLGVIAIVLAIEMKSLLIGESAAMEIQGAIQTTIERSHSVRKLIHMRTLHLGPDELLVAVKVEFDVGLDIPGLASAIDDLETAIRQRVPIARVIYVEPDITRSTSA